MRALLAFTCLTAIMAAGCDEEALRPRGKGATAATAATGSVAVAASPSAPLVRPTIKPEDLKEYAALPAAFESPDNPITPAKVELGRMLYYDKRLSKNHDVSCNSCHDLVGYGVDGKARSPGHKGQLGGRNSPTVYNAGGHVAQFWDGRAKDLEEQAKGPILNPVEMAMPDEASVVRVLASMPGYVEAFKKAFPGEPDPVTYDNVGRAIGAFERQLVTPARFDRWLGGDEKALTDVEVAGFAKFIDLGCPTCHVGPAVGGGSFQKLGLVKPWPDVSDPGRFEITKSDSDQMKFRVPSLRNIDKTGPYFHKGQVQTLPEVVELMAWHQLGQKLDKPDIELVVAFLASLTGEIPREYITEPKLPESTEATPKPDPS